MRPDVGALSHNALDRLQARQVCADSMEAGAGVAAEAFRLLHRGAANRNDGRARFGERQTDTLTQASIGAGHDGIFTSKVEGVRHRRSLTAGFP